jgi:hypothetical protein
MRRGGGELEPERRALQPMSNLSANLSVPKEPAMHTHPASHADPGYEIRFQSLFHEGRAMSFPCNALGHVNLDAMSQRVRNNYLFARAMIGREYAMPVVRTARRVVH